MQDEYVIILAAQTFEHLTNIKYDLLYFQECNNNYLEFTEPDLDNRLTALGLINPNSKQAKILSKLPLAGNKY